MISKEKIESKSAKWKQKWDKRLKSKLASKSLKWKSKWNERQGSFAHNKSLAWGLKWARKSAKTARRFGVVNKETRDEIRKMRRSNFYISSHF